jgi:hypothetical protein
MARWRSELPCPSCGQPIPMALMDFFPKRLNRRLCSHCGRFGTLPLRAVLVGFGGMLVAAAVLLAVAGELGWSPPFGRRAADGLAAGAWPELLVSGLIFLGLCYAAAAAGAFVCRMFADHLEL